MDEIWNRYDPVSALAMLSRQMAPGTPASLGFERYKQAIQTALAAQLLGSGVSLSSITFEATNWDELYIELLTLRCNFESVGWALANIRYAVLPLISDPGSVP